MVSPVLEQVGSAIVNNSNLWPCESNNNAFISLTLLKKILLY